ncbi:hypothetical protein CROQUDRAFT_90688 [Cronartium quercuum f. sp. fusiforme G11]|uniref:Uncharacterized protein n=1 Tax=Cronartium quercuum f. sp. fusiforme G11 TaxID=708437 RepID=A0A9P6TDU9_9BASI|nr:hypothetical protein CROQUDRAFT_90688 [Cronartium quercuum f. sp. fusiforme G11]
MSHLRYNNQGALVQSYHQTEQIVAHDRDRRDRGYDTSFLSWLVSYWLGRYDTVTVYWWARWYQACQAWCIVSHSAVPTIIILVTHLQYR